MKVYTTATASVVDSKNSVIDALSYSCINYAVCLPFIYLANQYGLKQFSPAWYACFWLIVLIVIPVVLPFVLIKLRTCKLALTYLPHPTSSAWDFVFSRRMPHYVIVTLKDGRRIGGLYAYKSFASSAGGNQIFIEEVWDVDGEQGYISKHTRTEGILILNTEIQSIEFIGIYDDEEKTE